MHLVSTTIVEYSMLNNKILANCYESKAAVKSILALHPLQYFCNLTHGIECSKSIKEFKNNHSRYDNNIRQRFSVYKNSDFICATHCKPSLDRTRARLTMWCEVHSINCNTAPDSLVTS